MLPITTIEGRLPEKAELKSGIGANGKEWNILTFTILADEYKGPGVPSKTHSFRITMFGPRAAKLYPKMVKGALTAAHCYVKQESYEKNGATVYVTNFVAFNVQNLVLPKSSQIDTSGYSDDIPPEAYGYGDAGADDDSPFHNEVPKTSKKGKAVTPPQAPKPTQEELNEAF